jgi:ABC-type lipoprotein export system ATPase subunit
LTVEENIQIPLLLNNSLDKDKKIKIKEIMQTLGILIERTIYLGSYLVVKNKGQPLQEP